MVARVQLWEIRLRELDGLYMICQRVALLRRSPFLRFLLRQLHVSYTRQSILRLHPRRLRRRLQRQAQGQDSERRKSTSSGLQSHPLIRIPLVKTIRRVEGALDGRLGTR